MSQYSRVSQPGPSDQDLDRSDEKQKPRHKGDAWAYLSIYGTLAMALAIAVGHHLFYQRYDAIQVKDTSERIIKAAGNALSQGFSLLVGFSGATSLTQICWNIASKRFLSIDALNTLFHLPRLGAWQRLRQVITLPVIFISLLIQALFVINVFAPGALSIPPNAIYLPLSLFFDDVPDASIYQTIIENATELKNIPWPKPRNCITCQYKTPFQTMPMLRCHNANSATRSLAPGEIYPLYNATFNLLNDTQSGLSGMYQFLVDISAHDADNNTLTTTSTACSLSTNYVVVTVQTRLFPERGTWATIELPMQLPVRSNQRGDAIDQILRVTPSCSNADLYVSWLSCLLQQFVDHYAGFIDSTQDMSRAPKALPSMQRGAGFRRDDYSDFDADYFNRIFNDVLMRYYVERGNATHSNKQPITASESYDRWQYTPRRLWAPYITALVAFFITGVYATFCINANRGAMESGFSQFLMASRNSALNQALRSSIDKDKSSKALLKYEKQGVFHTNMEHGESVETPPYLIQDKPGDMYHSNASTTEDLGEWVKQGKLTPNEYLVLRRAYERDRSTNPSTIYDS